MGLLLFFGISYLFYESILISCLFVPFSILYVKKQRRQKAAERKWKLNLQFKEAMIALSSALQAGYSIENAFIEAKKDLELLYDTEEPIIGEFEAVVIGLSMNCNVEELLMDLADRSRVEDLEAFAEVFSVCKRTGGDLVMIISAALDTIGDRIEVKRQIKTLTAGKKLEAKIMAIVPLGIIAYMKLFSGGMLEPLYDNLFGRLIMTGLLAGYLAAYEWSCRIVEIEM